MITRDIRRLYIYTIPSHVGVLGTRWEFKRGHDVDGLGRLSFHHGGIIETPAGKMSRADVQDLHDLLGSVLRDWADPV